MKKDDIIKGRYHLISFLGAGVFGEVWRAHDNMLDMDVALKLYTSSDSSSISKLQQEYKNAVSLSHANILSPQYFDVIDNCSFMVSNICKKGSLRNITISEKSLWKLIYDVSSALKHLHEHSIVHNNLKPENIFETEDGSYVISDIALNQSTRATMSKDALDKFTSSIAYKASEAKRGHSSAKSDIWSLGAILFELLTDKLPNESDKSNIDTLTSSSKIYSEKLSEIIVLCLNSNENVRPSAQELNDIAKNVLNNKSPQPNIGNNIRPNTLLENNNLQNVGDVPRHWFASFYIWFFLLLASLKSLGCYYQSLEWGFQRYSVMGLLGTMVVLGEIMLLKKIRVGAIVSTAALFCFAYAYFVDSQEFWYFILFIALKPTAIYVLLLVVALGIRKNGYNQWNTMLKSIKLSEHKWIIWYLIVSFVVFLFIEIL